jgi:hypothetical protein
VQQVVGAVGDCGKVVEGDGDVVVLWAELVLEPASASSSRVSLPSADSMIMRAAAKPYGTLTRTRCWSQR